MLFNIVTWISFGSIIGLIAAYTLGKQSDEAAPLLLLGITGAVVGGVFGSFISSSTPATFNATGLLISVISSLTLIGLYKNISPQS